jgi:cytochrome c-type biogenesis protein CcmF
MDYIGEHLLPGQLGHFFIILSLVASLVATFAYFRSAQSKNESDAAYWKKLARIAFIAEVFSIVAIFIILFYIIYNHLFEYKYAWQHSSRSLEFKYMLACFWEGQEGSFLLWSFWHCFLGLLLIKASKKWEAPVMTVVSFTQFCLATMVAGLYIFGHKIGTNPFILLRDSGVLDNAPALHLDFDVTQPLRPDYMSSVTDGNDLNPLLQNYWMVIHPPVLFLGFASTLIPFAYVIAGLWKKNFGEWTKPALPWALFSAAVFGVGIMMGARWAYESLTFGGYWAWDPVENASLVPWMLMISGIHTLLIYKNSGHSLRATHFFFILSFGLVLYSTFLTRSGILGDSSVHAFTDLGMNLQLLLFLLVFVMPSFILFFIRYKSIPAIQKEENGTSREFWMFIGSLVFFLSALVIIGQTSLPVFNKLFGIKFAPPEDPEFAYNSIQIYVAVIIGLLTAVGQYLKYKETSGKYFWKKILIPTFIAAVLATLLFVFGTINYTKKGPVFLGSIWLAVVCAIYAIIANAAYIWLGVKGKLKLSGGSISHVGFGMVLLGILITSSNKEVLSHNKTGILTPVGDSEDPRENLTLIKGIPSDMGEYVLTYEKDSAHPKKQLWFYSVRFKSKNGKENFVLKPNAFVNYKGNEGLMANPSARHYWDHDIFTYITSLPNPEKQNDTATFKPNILKPGDSLFYSSGYLVLENVKSKDSLPPELFASGDNVYEAPIKVYSKTGSIFSVTSRLAIVKGEYITIPDTLTSEGMVLQLQKVNPDKSIELGVKESDAVMKFVTLKAYKYPFINLLWFGVIITAIGITISMVRRIQLNRNGNSGS